MPQLKIRDWLHPSFFAAVPLGVPARRALLVEKHLETGNTPEGLSLAALLHENDRDILNFLAYRQNQPGDDRDLYRFAFEFHEAGKVTGHNDLVTALQIAHYSDAEIAVLVGCQTESMETYISLYSDLRKQSEAPGGVSSIVFPFKPRDVHDPAALRQGLLLVAAHQGGRDGLMRLLTPEIGLTHDEHEDLRNRIGGILKTVAVDTAFQQVIGRLPEEPEQRMFWESQRVLLSKPVCSDLSARERRFTEVVRLIVAGASVESFLTSGTALHRTV